MPTKHRIKVQVPIPQTITPVQIIRTLQTFEPLLINHAYIADYHPISGPLDPRALSQIKRDPFFRDDCADLTANPQLSNSKDSRWWVCDVWEDVYWVPFLLPYFSRLKRYLAVGCKTASGIRFRQSIAGGVTTRGTFTVIDRRTGRAFLESESWETDTLASRSTQNEGEEQRPKSWDGETDIESDEDEGEDGWDIVCECEIEVPLIISVPQLLMRNANRKLCEHLCQSVIHAAVAEWNEYWFTI